jgi:phage terminase small subunit
MPPAALTPKQQEFVTQYLIDLNASAAAKRAGYSSNTAQEQASRLLSNVMIQAAIAQAQVARAQRTQVNADRVLLELARLGFTTVQDLYDAHGALRPVHEWPRDAAAAVVSVTSHDLFQVVDGERRLVGYARTVKLADKSKALALLGRHLGLLDAHGEHHQISDLLRAVLMEMHDHNHSPKNVTPEADWAPLPPGPQPVAAPGTALPAPPAPDEDDPVPLPAPPRPEADADQLGRAACLVLRGVRPQVRDGVVAAVETHQWDLAAFVATLIELGWESYEAEASAADGR